MLLWKDVLQKSVVAWVPLPHEKIWKSSDCIKPLGLSRTWVYFLFFILVFSFKWLNFHQMLCWMPSPLIKRKIYVFGKQQFGVWLLRCSLLRRRIIFPRLMAVIGWLDRVFRVNTSDKTRTFTPTSVKFPELAELLIFVSFQQITFTFLQPYRRIFANWSQSKLKKPWEGLFGWWITLFVNLNYVFQLVQNKSTLFDGRIQWLFRA